MFRARGFALRDAFGDVLRGLRTSEEAEDMPEIKNVTPAPRAKVPKESLPAADATLTLNNSGNLAAEPEPEIPGSTGVTEDGSPQARLAKLMEEAGITFDQMRPIISPNRLCAKSAKSLDDLTDENILEVIADFDIIQDATKAEMKQVAP